MKANKEISDKTYLYLKSGGRRTCVFYMLPKIHKGKFPPPGRPIFSSVDSPTEKISMLLDLILQPFVMNTKLYVKDTGDFISKVENTRLSEYDWIFSWDVTGLYTNIPHNEGINAIKKLLGSKEEGKCHQILEFTSCLS